MKAKEFFEKETKKDKQKVVYLRIDPELFASLVKASEESGISLNKFSVTALKYFLENLNLKDEV